jgi:hypothetical protein
MAKHDKRARTIALVLLLFLGLTALPAAIILVVDPEGLSMGLPKELLNQTPFSNFLIPGIILGLFNGILSLLIAFVVFRKHRHQSILVLFQGAVLTIWLTAEVLMGIFYALLTIPYYLVALLLLSCGMVMRLSKIGLSLNQ